MELTRRDAAAALAAIGATGGVAWGIQRGQRNEDDEVPDDGPSDDRVRSTMVAIAEVVYPEDVSGIPAFVEAFLATRLEQPKQAGGIRQAVAELDERAQSWHDDRVASLPVETRDRLLREVGADTAQEDPGGSTAERVRYYVVNELLLALYTSPTGGNLVGIENPRGHPGGTQSYRRGP